MQSLNNFIIEKLNLNKQTKILNEENLVNDIYNHFIINGAENYIDKSNYDYDDYLKALKESIKKWVNAYNITNVEGPYVYSGDKWNKDEAIETLLGCFDNPKDYSEIDYNVLKNKIGNNWEDAHERQSIVGRFKSIFKINSEPYLLGTSKRISLTISDICNAVVIYLVK